MQTPAQNEKLLAALAHVAIILPMWGILAPIVIWATQRDKSAFLRSHALQAIGWQVVEIILGPIAVLLYAGAGILGLGGLLMPVGMLALVGVFVIVWTAALVVLVMGCVAAYRAYEGRMYRYPFVGDYLARFER